MTWTPVFVNPENGVRWDLVARVALHPLQLGLLEELAGAERPLTPSELQVRLGAEALGLVAYHMRRLKQMGLVELVRTEQSRGSIAHYYTLARGIRP